MDTNNQAPKPTKPISDISPPSDTSLGNPTQFANVPVQAAPSLERPTRANPIAGAAAPLARPHPTNSKTDDLDKVLKDVNKDVKAAIQKPGTFSRPTLAIMIAILVGLALMAAAFFAFR